MSDDPSAPGGALSLDAATRKALKAQAHPLKPVVMIGEAGLSPTVLSEIDLALEHHQLVKIRVLGDDRDARVALMHEICAQTACAPVQMIGKLLVVWRPNPDREAAATGKTGRRRPKLPYQPKKAVGAGARAVPRRRPRPEAPEPAARGVPSSGGRRTSPAAGAAATAKAVRPARRSLKDAPGARSGERARPLARGAARGPAGSFDEGRPKRPGRSPKAAARGAKKAGTGKR